MADQRGGLLDVYRKQVGDPFASLLGGALRGYLGLDKATYADDEAYRTAQALGNMPGIGAPAGVIKAAMNAPDALVAMGGLLGKGVGKLAKKGGKAKTETYAPVRTAEEQSVLDAFGQKAVRESALERKVQRAAEDVGNEASKAPPVTAKKAKRQKVEPDVYRKMAAEQGDDAVIRAVNRGEHLKPDGSGGYIGAPRTVDSPQALGAMRRSLDSQFSDATKAIALADPDRLGTWYDRAKSGIAMSAQPHQLDNVLDNHSVYSAGVSPESELGFALKHQNSRVLGEPVMAYRGAPMQNLDEGRMSELVVKGADGDYSGPRLGFKIGEYRDKNDPRIPNTGLFGVNDFRAAQGFGYTTPDGKIWKGGVSATMHPFMDGETALTVQRANQAAVGGRTDWQGPHLQETPWVFGKAQDLYSRGKNARFKGDELDGVKAAIREANNTASDYFYKHTAAATHEAVPGASTGHVPSLLDAPFDEKVAYGLQGRWDVPSAYSLSDAPSVGAGNQDAIYSAMGLRQLPSLPSIGAYRNSENRLETNPMTIARPLLDFPTGGDGKVAELTQRAMGGAERFRAVIDAQEAGAWNLPNTMGSVKGKNAALIDTRPSGEAITGRQPTESQLRQVIKAVEDAGTKAGKERKKMLGLLDVGPPTTTVSNKLNALKEASGGYGVTATNRGAAIFPYDPNAGGAGISEILRRTRSDVTAAFPGASVEKSLPTSGYVPGIGKWGEDGIVPTAPFSGEATMSLLSDLSTMPPAVARNLSESEGVRSIIRQKIERDAALPGARRDIQNTRNFFAEADWSKVVDAIRKGAAPAAALAAAGYSASSFAGEE